MSGQERTTRRTPLILSALVLFWAVMAVVIWLIGSQTPKVRNFGHEFTRTCDALLPPRTAT